MGGTGDASVCGGVAMHTPIVSATSCVPTGRGDRDN